MRLLFAGTPEVALPSLEALLDSDHDVVAVLTRPDAPSGRGRHVSRSPVKERALDAGLEVLTPPRPSDPEFGERLRELAPDACPVVAYGALIPGAVLAVPPRGWVNLHFSLLPAWRGAAPVQHAIMAGDEVTGASTFLIEEGLDTGPVLGVMTEPIRRTDTAGDLLQRLATAGAGLLVATLDGLQSGEVTPVPQPADGVSHAPKLTAGDAEIRWRAPALAVERQIRGCTPAPGAWTTFRASRLKLGPVTVSAEAGHDDGLEVDVPSTAPGELVVLRSEVHVGTASGLVRLETVQPHGKRAMPAADWARGVRIEQGECLGG